MRTPSIEGIERAEGPSERSTVRLKSTCGREVSGVLAAVSEEGDVVVRTDMPPAPGERLVLRIAGGLRLVGTCLSRAPGEVRIGLHASLNKFHRDAGNVRPLRTDGPRSLSGMLVTLTTPDGRTARCGVRDVSLTGLFVWCDLDLAIGEPVRIGEAAAFVARVGEGGYGLSMAAGQLGEDAFGLTEGLAVAFGT